MKHYIYQSIIFCLSLMVMACSPSSSPIDYGADECHRCKMIISDKRFGAELVTTKGKVFKYDAIECLVPIVLQNGADEYSHILVTDFYSPKSFIDAKSASYLISEKLPSPMGGFLSAFVSSDVAHQAQDEYEGKTYNWDNLLEEYK